MFKMSGHTDSVTGFRLSPDGSFVLSNAMDNTGLYIVSYLRVFLINIIFQELTFILNFPNDTTKFKTAFTRVKIVFISNVFIRLPIVNWRIIGIITKTQPEQNPLVWNHFDTRRHSRIS